MPVPGIPTAEELAEIVRGLEYSLEDAQVETRHLKTEVARLDCNLSDAAEELAKSQKAAVAAEKRVAELEKQLQQEKDEHADTRRERNDARDERDDFRDQFVDMREKRDEILATCKTYEADFQAWRAMIRARNAFDTYENHPTEDSPGLADRLFNDWIKLEQISANAASEAWQGD